MGDGKTRILIPYAPRKEQQEMHEAMETHRFGVFPAHRRMGKTVFAINDGIKTGVICTKERPRVGYIAPYYSQAKAIAWEYLKHFTREIPGVRRNESELWVGFEHNKAQIRLFGADNPDALRGLYFDKVILDEVAQMKPEVWDEVIRPTLSDRNGQAIFIGSVAGEDLFFKLHRLAMELAGWCTKIYRVTDTNVLSAEEVALARQSMSEAAFAREYMCDFTAALIDRLILAEHVHEAAGKNIRPELYANSPKVMGVDPARFGDDRSILIVRQGLAVTDMIVWRDMDLMFLAAKVADEIKKHEPDGVFVDSVGLGAGLVDRLRQLGHKILSINSGRQASDDSQYYNLRAEMWARMRDWMIEGGGIPDDQRMRADLLSPMYSYDSRNRIKLEKKEDMKKRGLPSPDAGDALALTFAQTVHPRAWGGSVRAKQAKTEYDVLAGVP